MMVNKFTTLVFRDKLKIPHVTTIANFIIAEIFYWVVEIWRGVLLTTLFFLKLKTTFWKHWTFIKIKINMTLERTKFKVKIKMVQKQWQQLKR